MSIRLKIAFMIAVPAISLAVLIALGGHTMRGIADNANAIVNDNFSSLIDHDISPLISEDMLPLLNQDIVYIQKSEASIKNMLEADRNVRKAVITEKMSLVASEEREMAAVDKLKTWII